MCSLKWPELLGSEAVTTMQDVVGLVAERSFFSVAEPCSEDAFAELSRGPARWLVATVGFAEADFTGAVSCTLPEDLAHALFDAFSGRDPLDEPPPAAQLHDLVGEFSNIVCGTWLTRLANHQTFSLTRPRVCPAPDRSQLGRPDARLLMTVNDLPLAIEVRLATGDAPPEEG